MMGSIPTFFAPAARTDTRQALCDFTPIAVSI
jgi:hypothetical protein